MMTHGRPRRGLVTALIVAALAAACIAAPPTAAPSGSVPVSFDPSAAAADPSEPGASPSADLTGLDDATMTAIRIRQSYGLPSDLDHIRSVAHDPTATTEWGTPLLPAEVQELMDRSTRADRIIPTVQDYAAANRAVFGGVWIDQAAGGVVTVSFTDDLERHRSALARLLAGSGVVKVVQAHYAESVMRALQDRISADDAWFKTIPARLLGVGYDTIANRVSIEISTLNPDVEALIVARFGIPADSIRVESDGTGAALLPYGTVRGIVLLADGKVPGQNSLMVDFRSTVPGSCGSEVGIGVMPNGKFEIPCQVGPRTIVISDFPPNGGDGTIEVGHGDVVVPANGIVTVTIHIDHPG